MEDLEEEWVDVIGFSRYTISTYGEVYSWITHRVLRPTPSGWGYLQVMLRQDNKSHTKHIHKMVAQHFVPGEDFGLEPNHIDGNKKNNRADNLEWVTKRENNQHAFDTGLNPGRGTKVELIDTGQIFSSVVDCAYHLNGSANGLIYVLKGRAKTDKFKGHRVRYVS